MPELKYTISIEAEQLKRDLAIIAKYPTEFGDAQDEAKEKSVDAYKRITREVSGVDAALKAMHRDADTMAISTREKVEGLVKYYGEWAQITRTKLVEAHGEMGRVAGEFIPQQTMGMSSAIRSFKSSMLSEIPFGGLIGLMVLGGKRDEDIRAASTSAMRIFTQVGEVGRGELTGLKDKVYDLSTSLGMGPEGLFAELGASAGAFSSFGVQAGEALQKMKLGETGVVEQTIMATMRLDSFFKLAAGTSARAAGDMVRNFGLGVVDATKTVAAMAITAQDAGVNVQSFLQSVASSSSVLRTQRVDIGEVAAAQLKLKAAIEGTIAANMKDPEAKRAFATGYAEQAVGQVTRAVAGLSVGMSAVLAERITERGGMPGGPVSGLQAYYAFKEGFGGAGQSDKDKGLFAESVTELANMAKENSETVEDQKFFLEKVAGVGPEGARGILAMAEDIAGGLDVDTALKNNQDKFKTAFDLRAEETSKFQIDMQKIQKAIAELGSGILGAVINGFKSLGWSITWAVQSILTAMKIGGSAYERDKAAVMIDIIGKRSDKAWNKMGASMWELGEAVGGFGGDAIDTGENDEEEIIKRLGKRPIGDALKNAQGRGLYSTLKGLMSGADPVQQVKAANAEITNLLEQEFMTESGAGIKKALLNMGFNEKTAGGLVSVYKRDEADGGRGEASVEAILRAKEKKGLLPKGHTAGEFSGSGIEAAAVKTIQTRIRSETGDVVPLDIRVYIGNHLTGQVEGS